MGLTGNQAAQTCAKAFSNIPATLSTSIGSTTAAAGASAAICQYTTMASADTSTSMVPAPMAACLVLDCCPHSLDTAAVTQASSSTAQRTTWTLQQPPPTCWSLEAA